jgi:hypothetical protein
MTINGCEVEKNCEGDPEIVRDAAIGYLVKLGYKLKGRTAKRVHLKYDGTLLTTKPDRLTHHVYVSASDGKLHFEFSTGIVASYWTEADVAFADARAAAAARAASAFVVGDYRSPVDEPMMSCRFCGKISLESAPACDCCGAAPLAR